jgi:hypothetical protein
VSVGDRALNNRTIVRSDQPTDLGRIVTAVHFAEYLWQHSGDDICHLFCSASEFAWVTVRPDGEGEGEVATLLSCVPISVHKAPGQPSAKVNVLLQCCICRLPLSGLSLMADIAQNAASS